MEGGTEQTKRVPCPFHPEGEPTLEVDLETGRYECRHCGAAGILTPEGEHVLRMEYRWWSFI